MSNNRRLPLPFDNFNRVGGISLADRVGFKTLIEADIGYLELLDGMVKRADGFSDEQKEFLLNQNMEMYSEFNHVLAILQVLENCVARYKVNVGSLYE